MTITISDKKKIFLFSKVSPLDIALSMRHLAIMLKTGLAIEDALKVLAEQTTDERLKIAFTDTLDDVRSGMAMAESMIKHKDIFSEIIISIISVGEQGATLEKNLIFLADYLKKNYELQRKVKGALLYPMIIFSVTILEMIGVVYFILPKLESLFSSFKNISGFTLFVLQMAAFIRSNGVYLAAGIIILILGINRLLATDRGKRFKDRVALKIPVMKNLTRNNILTTFSRS